MPSIESAELARTIALAPFSPRRAPPEVVYTIGRPASPAAPVVAPSTILLLGTVVSESGRSFAMCQEGGGPPKLVYPGQRIGTLTLESVSQGSAIFTDIAGSRVVLRVPKAGG